MRAKQRQVALIMHRSIRGISCARSRAALVAVLLVFVAAEARATQVYIEQAAPDAGRGIVYYGSNSGSSNRETWWGGQRLVRVSDTPDFASSYEIGVFCLEPFGDLPFEDSPLLYTVGTMDDIALNAIQQERMQLLFDNAYSILTAPVHPLDFAVRATAFQVLVWEIMEDGATAAPLSLTSGTTRVNILPQDNSSIQQMYGLATNWVDALNSNSWSTTGIHQIGVFYSDDLQDLGFTVIIPEPTSWAMAAIALFGLAMFGRRR